VTPTEEKAQRFAEKVRAIGERAGLAIVEAASTPNGVDMLKVMSLLGVVMKAQESGSRYIAGLVAPLEENEEYQRMVGHAAFLQMLGAHDAFAGEPPQQPDEYYLDGYCDAVIARDELQ
jgi:hypothetical protein